ncbi:MAG: hypothetical protein JXR73_11125 [Candidatus Omnitrophica bacterium]|nr:hypothetical protein [Candidatus Omnitrophota bacterium]
MLHRCLLVGLFLFLLLSSLEIVSYAQSPGETSFILQVPAGTRVVGVFDEFRTIEEEYQLLSAVYLKSGDHDLPLETGEYPFTIFERMEFGPERKEGWPLEEGRLTAERSQTAGEFATVDYTIEQDMEVDGQRIHLTWDYLYVELQDGTPITPVMALEEPYLSQRFYMTGQIVGSDDRLEFASEAYEPFPAYLLDVDLEDGQSVKLYYRWQMPMAGSGPANLVFAEVEIQEGQTVQTDYWRLVYSASHHNWDERFWVLFDQPLGEAYGVAVFRRNVFAEGPQQVYTLDVDLQPLREIGILKMNHMEVDQIPFPSAVPNWRWY